MGQVVLQTLPEGPPVCGVTSLVPQTLPEGPPVYGVTSLADEVFVLRGKGGSDQVEVYDAITYRSQRCLTVPNCLRFADVTSCEHYQCIYISEPDVECIHRLDSQGKAATQWPVNDKPFGLSVNTAHNLLVACRLVSKIKEFSTHGYLLREITLPDDVIKPWHAIQLTSGQFVVCHGNLGHPVHRVCMVSADGRQIVHSHGGQPGSSNDQCNGPMHLTVDENQFLFVADINNRRVKLLSPTLRYIRDVSSDLLKWLPNRLCLDTERSRLYIADCDLKDGKWTAGRVVVVSV